MVNGIEMLLETGAATEPEEDTPVLRGIEAEEEPEGLEELETGA